MHQRSEAAPVTGTHVAKAGAAAHQSEDDAAAASELDREELIRALSGKSERDRAAAARRLRTFGREAVEPLCSALRDRDDSVRAAAAESLGEVGDDRAIAPLLEALRSTFPGKSPRRSRLAGLALAVLGSLAVIAAVVLMVFEGAGGLVEILANSAGSLGGSGKTTTTNRRTMVEALARIAERSPTPELRAALPDLREIAADFLQQDRPTRQASRAASEQIEALTARLQALPIASGAPPPDVHALPRATEAPAADVATLPRPTSAEG